MPRSLIKRKSTHLSPLYEARRIEVCEFDLLIVMFGVSSKVLIDFYVGFSVFQEIFSDFPVCKYTTKPAIYHKQCITTIARKVFSSHL